MQPFAYHRPDDAGSAIDAARSKSAQNGPPAQAPGQFISGGTNMSDYMKLNVMQPEVLVDINRLADPRYREIRADERGLRFGALVRMSQAEDHPVVKSQYPVIYDTLHLAATRQIRNMASLGGNPLQRTRCEYFRETSWPCNKRNPGSGCSAMNGLNRQHAVLGTSEQCIAAYPGDFAQALIALDATVEIMGPNGARTIAFSELHRLPADTPNIETVLEPGELITFIDVPAGPWTRRSRYIKVRDRQSYQFALTSAAVAIDLDGKAVRDVRIALGGVATVPWRARDAEAVLKGKALDESTAMEAANVAFSTAQTREHNAFKVPIGKQTLVRALLEAKLMEA
ncbi:FAD binding domain-containing protein [Microvirga sp. 2TAF3]|uniref:FAD binding domain-containing protein n=1 Tax=Microvirga sp. 2TAF3 TaxID=3233014 RepID=UPI003F983B00